MPQNVETEMLLITSDDYWGHAGDFDPAVNFYPYTFIITQSQYASMDDSDKGRFFPCALFYYAGETDNHGFQPRRIGCRVEDNDTVSMGRVMGINRQGDQEVRTYRLGTEQGYAIPGYASMSMLKGEGDSYEAIESAAEAGSLPVGGFDISGLIYNQEAVVDTINTVAGIETDDSAAENFSAEEATPFEYDGAEPEAYVARPEATPVGYDVDDNSAAVEDYFASEGYNFNHTVGDFAQDSAAGSGYGVPEYYGTNSMSPMAFEAEVMYGTDGSVVGQAVGNWDSTPFGYQAEGDEGPEVMWEQDEFVSVRDGSARDAIADEYLEMGEDYDDAEDYARRAAKKMSAEGLGDYTGPLTNGFGENSASVSDYGVPVWYGSAEEAYNGMGENSASISGQGVPQWYGSAEAERPMSLTNYTDEQLLSQFQMDHDWLIDNGFTSFHQIVSDGGPTDEEAFSHLQNMATTATVMGYRGKQRQEYLDMEKVLMDFYLAGAEKNAEELGPGVGMPAVDDGFYPNSYGEDSSTFGQGVPQWYGSAEQGYNDKMDESLGMRHRGSHSQSMKDRRDEAAAMDKKYGMKRKYDDVETMDSETASFGAMPSFTEDPAYLNRKTNDFERTDVTGAVMYRGRLMPCVRCGDKSRMIFGSRSDPMFVCESRECHNVLGIKNLTFDGMPPLQVNSAESVVKVQKSETKMAMAIGAAVLGALTAYTISRKVGGSDEPEEPEEPEE